MALSAKQMRDLESVATESVTDFDFGEPEVLSVEIAPGKFLSLQEPSAEDLIEIGKVESALGKEGTEEIEVTLRIICIMHHPTAGQRKLTLKDARKLRSKQIAKLAAGIKELIGGEQDDDDTKSDDGTGSDYEDKL
jgi:hypothetical protein